MSDKSTGDAAHEAGQKAAQIIEVIPLPAHVSAIPHTDWQGGGSGDHSVFDKQGAIGKQFQGEILSDHCCSY